MSRPRPARTLLRATPMMHGPIDTGPAHTSTSVVTPQPLSEMVRSPAHRLLSRDESAMDTFTNNAPAMQTIPIGPGAFVASLLAPGSPKTGALA